MWDWIKAYKVPFYETFWQIRGEKEYEFIYKKKISEEIQDILDQCGKSSSDAEVEAVLAQCIKSVSKEASIHFGQPYFNTATMAGLYRMMLKSFAVSFGVTFPASSSDGQQKPWYADYLF